MGFKNIFKKVINDICVEGLNMDEQKVYKMLNKSEILRKEREEAARKEAARKAERAEKARQKREARKIEQARRAEQMRKEQEIMKKHAEEQKAEREARDQYILNKYKYSGWRPEISYPEEDFNKLSESIKNLKEEIYKNAIANGLQPDRELASSVKFAELIREREKWVMDRAHARILYSILEHVAEEYSITSEFRIVDIPDDRFLRVAQEYTNNHRMVEAIFKKGYAFNYYKSFPNDPISYKRAMSMDEFRTKIEQFANEGISKHEKLEQELTQIKEEYHRLLSQEPVMSQFMDSDQVMDYLGSVYKQDNEYYIKKVAWNAQITDVKKKMKYVEDLINRLSYDLIQKYGLDQFVLEKLKDKNSTANFLVWGLP